MFVINLREKYFLIKTFALLDVKYTNNASLLNKFNVHTQKLYNGTGEASARYAIKKIHNKYLNVIVIHSKTLLKRFELTRKCRS